MMNMFYSGEVRAKLEKGDSTIECFADGVQCAAGRVGRVRILGWQQP